MPDVPACLEPLFKLYGARCYVAKEKNKQNKDTHAKKSYAAQTRELLALHQVQPAETAARGM